MKTLITSTLAALALAASSVQAQGIGTPFGSDEEIGSAELLWDRMEAGRLAAPHLIRSFPNEGTQPHGAMLETLYSVETMDGHTGDLIVMRNFGPDGVSVDDVLADPEGHLGAYTVSFRREEDQEAYKMNWFWVRYGRDGAISRTGTGEDTAGRLDEACADCHRACAGLSCLQLGSPDRKLTPGFR